MIKTLNSGVWSDVDSFKHCFMLWQNVIGEVLGGPFKRMAVEK